ncbi:hypothetical protein FAUST_150 [Fusarium austroamericanum]|uniref:Uncharacterized protein n=1 Tax=Fusarium austroamericanum TaxID=282268 RepID=A0AAN6HKX7_FUSAU|nr:hypothetical protein FAUST_150 [Fusarium austroamericanum]
MSSTATQQDSVTGTTDGPNAPEPPYMSLGRVDNYASDNIIASMSTRNKSTGKSHDKAVASLEFDMAGYKNTVQYVNPPFPLTGTGSKFVK